MKNTFRAVIISAALIAVPFAASAVEFGGVVSNNSTLKTNKDKDFKLDQVDTASLWIKAPLVKSETVDSYLAAQGTYSFEHNFDSADTIQYLDLDLLKYVYNRRFNTNEIEISAGRFFTFDVTGVIYAQKADGVNFEFKSDKVELTAYGAYTGLLNAQADTMLSYDLSKLSGDKDKIYDCAEKNIAGILCLKLPSLFAGQTIAVQGTGAFKAEDKSYNRIYATADISGPVSSMIYYDANTTFGFTQYDGEDFQAANLTKLTVSAFPQFKNSSVTVNGVYASGKQGGLKAFRGITSNTACEAASEPEYSGLLKAGIAGTIKPVEPLLVSASFDTVFDAASGTDKDEIKYHGVQFAFGADWQAASDFSVGVKYSQYAGDDSSNDRKKLSLKASLKF